MNCLRLRFHKRTGGRVRAGRRPVCPLERGARAAAAARWASVALALVAAAALFRTRLAGGDEGAASFDRLAAEYDATVRHLLTKYRFGCHSTEKHRGDVDFERFATFEAVRAEASAWEKVLEMLEDEEMPPKKAIEGGKAGQPTPEERAQLVAWGRALLRAEARAAAGDPGRVVLRRLSNAEYTYTVRDLTGVRLDPAREFPVDGAAGEGFTNTGESLGMSPTLLAKYLDAAKEIASHAVLLPEGLRFSEKTSRRDWTDEAVARIRAFYSRYADAEGRAPLERYFRALVEHRLRREGGAGGLEHVEGEALAEIAAREGLSRKYLESLARALEGGGEPFGQPRSSSTACARSGAKRDPHRTSRSSSPRRFAPGSGVCGGSRASATSSLGRCRRIRSSTRRASASSARRRRRPVPQARTARTSSSA